MTERIENVVIPDIGDIPEVDVVEVLVQPGDRVKKDDSLISLESDKATMDVPSPYSGTVKTISIATGDRVKRGSPILTISVNGPGASELAGSPESEGIPRNRSARADDLSAVIERSTPLTERPDAGTVEPTDKPAEKPHASPSVRRFARDLGADLKNVKGTGRKSRILREDIQAYIKNTMRSANSAQRFILPVPESPQIDFAQFGEIETQSLTRIKKLAAKSLHSSWVTIPHVTQHDEADITDLEGFRQKLKREANQKKIKVTLLPFIIKALVTVLKAFPRFNASLASSGEQIILKHYYHFGIAVDTTDGLIVPVLRDVDKKGIFQLASELMEISERARNKKLNPDELQGGSFTISSLGGISGTAFTPIINSPDVAILGVSKAKTRAIFRDGEFTPRLILPLSLSYDHRVIDGAEAARFTNYLAEALFDLRRGLL